MTTGRGVTKRHHLLLILFNLYSEYLTLKALETSKKGDK